MRVWEPYSKNDVIDKTDDQSTRFVQLLDIYSLNFAVAKDALVHTCSSWIGS